MKKIIFKNQFYFVLTILLITVVYACIKEPELSQKTQKGGNNSTSQTLSDTILLKGKDGICYRFVVNQTDNMNISVTRESIDCLSEINIDGTLYIEPVIQQTLINNKGVLTFEQGKKYWYIPIGGQDPVELSGGANPGGGEFECFCESPSPDPFCDGTAGGCNLEQNGGYKKEWRCIPQCCGDCDMRWCQNCLTGNGALSLNGIIICASNILVDGKPGLDERNSYSDQIIYGGNCRIEVKYLPNKVLVYRYNLGSFQYDPNKVYNLTSISPQGGKITFPQGGSIKIVTFVPGSQCFTIGGDGGGSAHCEPDGVCSGSCEMFPVGQKQCLECQCTLEGDCDMVIDGLISNGGIAIEAQIVELVDL